MHGRPGLGQKITRPGTFRPGESVLSPGHSRLTKELAMDYFWFFTGLVLVITTISFLKISTKTDD